MPIARSNQPLAALHRRARIAAAALLLSGGAAAVRADDLKLGGTGAALGTMRLLADSYALSHPQHRITVLPSMGSSGAIKAVLAGAIELGLSGRPLAEGEIKNGAAETEYGRTPFVFATAASAKPTGVSTRELADLYAGRTEHWPDGSKVRLVLRPVGEADTELVKSLAPALREAHTVAEQRQGMSFAVTDQETAKRIEDIPGALGASTLALILSEKRSLKALKLNGMVPDARSIADGSYPLQRPMRFVTGPKTPAVAHDFIAFVRSPAGRAILVRTGHWVR